MKLHFWTLTSVLSVLTILFLSFYPFAISEEKSFFEHQDKLAHFLLYSFLTFALIKSFRKEINFRQPIFFASVISFLLGTLIEILQPVLTDYRQGSFSDVIFNSSGILFTLFLFTFRENNFWK